MALPSLSLAVVGVDFPNKRGPGRRFEVEICRPGEPIELRPEPQNEKDEHAVAVYSCRGIQIGYIKAERAPWIGAMIRQGRPMAVIFQEQTSWGAVIRAAFDGEEPALPPARPAPPAEPDFYPDPIYDDE